MNDTTYVQNAGLVLLNNYFQMLFERLELLENGQFVSVGAQKDAVRYLQYLATGLTDVEEAYLPLNKVLCGLSISEPIPNELSISVADKELMDGLIKAAINHWSAIGESSIDGFRGNWLVRAGMLKEQEDNFELTVEKKAYDLLINQSPFSFATIKYPWMSKLIRVTWPY